jgi:hypothetical protein
MVYRGINNDLKNLMSLNQHDFMKNRSTITNLLEYESFVLNLIEDGNHVNSIYTDFSKAFDRVHHQLLLNEMSVGIEPARCMWLGSYLSERIQKVRIDETVFKDIKVTSGHLYIHRKVTWDHFASSGLITSSCGVLIHAGCNCVIVLDRVSSINNLGVIMDEKGFCDARIYQETFVGV